jgi:hypothetical protein
LKTLKKWFFFSEAVHEKKKTGIFFLEIIKKRRIKKAKAFLFSHCGKIAP